jgi:hypothetical protein
MSVAADVNATQVRPKNRLPKCPFCPDCDWVRRTRLQWYESLLWVFGVRPFVCLQCWRRFYDFRREVRSSLQSRKETR